MIKNYLQLLFLLSFSFAFSQESNIKEECGTEKITKYFYAEHPEIKLQEDAFNLKLSKFIKKGNLPKLYGKKTNQIYEIPIVVHVVSDGSAIGSPNNRSDAEIINWIDHTNDLYSGILAPGSTPIPVKLVLAKTDPSCNSTNGINRINASQLPNYVANGIDSQMGQAGLYQLDLTALGKWDPLKYYNIYVVNNTADTGISNGGWALLASGHGTSFDHAIIQQNAVVLPSRHHVLSHKFGHAMGLYHTQEGSSGSTCPVNNDCTLDGEFVCDTEPNTLSSPTTTPCQTAQINLCTGTTYTGVVSNIMTYTACYRDQFTAGQRDRAIAQLLYYRESLLNSPVSNASSPNNMVSLTPACIPTATTSTFNNFGITAVKFGKINNYSKSYQQSDNNFYEDFTGSYCLSTTTTTIPLNTGTIITITPGSFSTVSHIVRAYIDYNNNGQFDEVTERILSQTVSPGSVVTASITPPSNSILNTPLRLRVIGDSNNFASNVSACYNPIRGQVEDYSVVIENQTLSAENIIKINDVIIVTKDNTSIYVKSKTQIASVSIYDSVGRLLFAKKGVHSTEFNSESIRTENLIVIVKIILENGKIITRKIRI